MRSKKTGILSAAIILTLFTLLECIPSDIPTHPMNFNWKCNKGSNSILVLPKDGLYTGGICAMKCQYNNISKTMDYNTFTVGMFTQHNKQTVMMHTSNDNDVNTYNISTFIVSSCEITPIKLINFNTDAEIKILQVGEYDVSDWKVGQPKVGYEVTKIGCRSGKTTARVEYIKSSRWDGYTSDVVFMDSLWMEVEATSSNDIFATSDDIGSIVFNETTKELYGIIYENYQHDTRAVVELFSSWYRSDKCHVQFLDDKIEKWIVDRLWSNKVLTWIDIMIGHGRFIVVGGFVFGVCWIIN